MSLYIALFLLIRMKGVDLDEQGHEVREVDIKLNMHIAYIYISDKSGTSNSLQLRLPLRLLILLQTIDLATNY